jgi:hypothetical protein
MRKVKITQQENGRFSVEGQDAYPEIKGKKLVILTKGQFSNPAEEQDKAEWEISSDEALLLTEEEFHAVRDTLKKTAKG